MTVVVAGIIGIVLVVTMFLSALMVALMTEERRSQRYVGKVEKKLDQLIYANMTSEERQRELRRIQRIEDEQRRAHGAGGY